MKNMTKKNIILPLLLIFLIFLIYYGKYSINDSNKSIEYYLVKNNYINSKDISIQKQIIIKDMKIVIFKCDGALLQYALFQKGLNGKYQFIHITSKNDLMCISVIEKIKNDYYLVSLGYNPQNNLYINTTLSPAHFPNKKINEFFNIKNEKYFIKYKVINDQTKYNYGVSNYNMDNFNKITK